MKLQFVGADHQVTGSCHYVEAAGKKFVVDFGMEQGNISYESKGLPCPEAEIDFVLLTHAHVDHSGMLPYLYKMGFRGNIYATEATVDLCGIMLRDCAHIQMQEAEWKSRKAKRSADTQNSNEPIYNFEDALGAIQRLVPCSYDKIIDLAEGIKIRFTDVGHLLGSASIEVFIEEKGVRKTLCFSGDIGNHNQPLIREPKYTKKADYVIMESTYGDRLHEKAEVNPISDLARIIDETLEGGGNVVIPSFAVGRTQEILYFIRQIKEEGLVKSFPDFPVYMDSPLAVDATDVFKKNISSCFDDDALQMVKRGVNPIYFDDLNMAITSEESKAINFDDEPKVIISASGMCEAGRIRHHLKHNLWRPECTVLFVGYQAAGTLGRALVDGADEVKLFGETIAVKAAIMQFPGLSGHADKDGLVEWLAAFEEKPAMTFIVHGDDIACESFCEYVNKEMKIPAHAPYSGTIFNLATGEFELEAVPERRKKRIFTVNDAFARLVAAGQRLLQVIYKNEGHANKDLAKFTSQINSLSDKWDPDFGPSYDTKEKKSTKNKKRR